MKPELAQSLLKATFKNLGINIDFPSNEHKDSTTMAQPIKQQNTACEEGMEVWVNDIKW